MEGGKRRIVRSLKFRLCLILSVIAAVFAGSVSLHNYHVSMERAAIYVDEELSQIAGVIVNYSLLIPKRWQGPTFRNGRIVMPHGMMHHQESSMHRIPSLNDLFEQHRDIIIAPLFSPPGEVFYFPLGIEDGFYTLLINDNRVRAIVTTNHENIRFVVARPLSIIESMVNRAMWTSLLEFAVLLLVFLPTLIIIVNVMLAPVNRMAKGIYKRRENDFRPLTGKVPSELDAFLDALNRLFKKTSVSLQNERRFIADAAHELRTPLTALSLQIDSFDLTKLDWEDADKLTELKKTIRRQRDLTNDLLTLARSQCQSGHKEESFSVKDLYIGILEELGPLADSRNIDFGLDGEVNAQLVSDRGIVKTIVYNLCSNALKYTQENGRCDLKCEVLKDRVNLIVSDNGPGIPEKELKKVFEPFYRVDGDRAKTVGTGLGLAIVETSCVEIGAQILLENKKSGGLKATVGILTAS